MIYPRRFEFEPRKRKAYCSACDAIAVYGVPRKQWKYQIFDISRSEMKTIWNTAMSDMNGKSRYDYIREAKI